MLTNYNRRNNEKMIDETFFNENIKPQLKPDTDYETFMAYYNTLNVDDVEFETEIRTFDKLYNGHQIKNPTKDGKYYYILKYNNKVFLQRHKPFVSGYVGLTDDNINDVIDNHKSIINSQEKESQKLQLTITHFKKE